MPQASVGRLRWPTTSTVDAPVLVYTHGNTCYALGTWDGGTKITLRQTNGFLVTMTYPGFSFLYSYTLGSYISGLSSSVINMAVDDDGYAYVWAIATGSSNWRLFKLDIAANTSTPIFTTSSSTSNLYGGPSWNPNDGLIYELTDYQDGYYEIDSYTSGGSQSFVTDYSMTYGFARSDMVSFTPDGALWFDVEGASGDSEPTRYDGSSLGFTVADFNSATPVPRTSESVWTSRDGGLILHADGSSEATDASLFTSGGTARVHCGLNGLVTFLYPTSGGSGVDVYEHVIP